MNYWTLFIDWLVAHSDQLEALTRFAVVVGIPLGLVQAWWRFRKEQRSREYGTYNALDEKYLDFQKLCLARPYLDVFDVPDPAPTQLTPLQQKEETVAFTFLFAIFERAFLMYSEQPRGVRQRQWTGWQTLLAGYCKRANFRKAWTSSGETFDTRFQEYMAGLLTEDSRKRSR